MNVLLSIYLGILIQATMGQECNIVLDLTTSEAPIFIPIDRLNHLRNHQHDIGFEPFVAFPKDTGPSHQVDSRRGESFLVSCPGRRNDIQKFHTKDLLATCNRRTTFSVNDQQIDLKNISCKERPDGTLLHTEIPCGKPIKGQVIFIGWRIDPELYIPFIKICWNQELGTPIYTEHVIHGRYLTDRHPSPGRPSFRTGRTLPSDITEYFKRSSQRKLLAPLLDENNSNLGSSDYFFARGHLAPDADFILPGEQDSTYYLANVVPQFQNFNNGNWKLLESLIRDMAALSGKNLRVYTGTLSVLSLKNKKNKDMEIFLDPINKRFPVPLIIYKVVVEQNGQSVVVLGLNIGKYDSFSVGMFESLCRNVCHRIHWLRQATFDVSEGPIICCQPKDVVSSLPFDL